MRNRLENTENSKTQGNVQSKLDQGREIHFSEVALFDHNLANEIGLNPLKQAVHWNLNLVRIINHSPILVYPNKESRSFFVDKTKLPQKIRKQSSDPEGGFPSKFSKRKQFMSSF